MNKGNDSNLQRAMTMAAEYRQHNREGGDVALAQQCRETINVLVARWVDGRVVLPREIADAMGRPELGA